MEPSTEEIRRRGLQALRRELGLAGLVKFLRQYFPGRGNWAKERHAWVDRLTMEDVRRWVQEHRPQHEATRTEESKKRTAKPRKRRRVA